MVNEVTIFYLKRLDFLVIYEITFFIFQWPFGRIIPKVSVETIDV